MEDEQDRGTEDEPRFSTPAGTTSGPGAPTPAVQISAAISTIEAAATVALVPTNPQVQAIAARLRWRAERLIARVKRALPASVEQLLYLQLGESFRIHPETMATLLREYLGEQTLQSADLEDRSIGRNLYTNKFADVAEFLKNALGMLDKESLDIPFSISARTAAKLAIAYGDHVEDVISAIVSNLNEIAERLRMRHSSEREIIGVAVSFLLTKAMEYTTSRGLPDPLDILDFFEGQIEPGLRNANVMFEQGDAWDHEEE